MEEEDVEAPNPLLYSSDIDSGCSTPYVSAPSSPGRSSSAAASTTGGYFYSAPTSPMHFFLLSSSKQQQKQHPSSSEPSLSNSDFEFSSRFSADPSPADELFLNGQIRPMKLKSHLLNPQKLSPLLALSDSDPALIRDIPRGRESKPSSRRRTRSMSPLRKSITWHRINNVDKCDIKEEDEDDEEEVVATMSASSSRSSSGGRSSKRWIFLKEFLYRSKSEGRNNNPNSNSGSSSSSSSNKIWSKFSFSPVKSKKAEAAVTVSSLSTDSPSTTPRESVSVKKKAGPTNGVGKKRVPLSAHEMHYKANRAQAEEMRKKTFLPYRQGLIGCLGFSSKGYGAVNGLARALNPVSSR